MESKLSSIDVYTDGSYKKSKNGKNDVLCGYGIYFPIYKNNEPKKISRKFTHAPITSNRAELYAIYKAIILTNILNENRIKNKQLPIKCLNIYSDSEYSVKIFTEWLKKWVKINKLYLNKDIIDEIADHILHAPFNIKFTHISAHTGKNDIHSLSNEIADGLAKNGALK